MERNKRIVTLKRAVVIIVRLLRVQTMVKRTIVITAIQQKLRTIWRMLRASLRRVISPVRYKDVIRIEQVRVFITTITIRKEGTTVHTSPRLRCVWL